MAGVELEAAAVLYQGATLERIGIFALSDRIAELWLRGGIAVAAIGDAARTLDRYWLGRNDRLAADERMEVYARVFDARFEELWVRLLGALAATDADAPAVRAAAAAVRAHLGATVDEAILALTPHVHGQLGDALEVLSIPEIGALYGARDMWQLVDTLGRLELGRTPDVPRVRTMAAAGAAIVGWLGEEDDAVTEELAGAARAWLAAVAAPEA